MAIVGAPPKFNAGCCCCSCVEPAAGIVVATFELPKLGVAETEAENNEVGLFVVAAAAVAPGAAPNENPDAAC